MLGGVLGGFAAGGVASLTSFIGLLAVFTIAVRYGMSLLDHYRRLERDSGRALTPEQIRAGTAERLGSIMTTTIVTALVLSPFVFLGNIAGLEILRPMAIVVLGGLVTATLVSLLVMPSLYARFGTASGDLDLN
jgi:Cu/Ag efflux pump CusA